MRDEQLVKFARRWSTAIGLTIQYIITNLFSRLLPLVSGGLFGIGVYAFWMEETNAAALSVTMAVFTAGGVEAVGFMASHRAIKAYEEKRPLILPLAFVAIYLLVGGGALWFTDVALAHKIITTAVFLLVAVNYALIGMETLERKESAVERKAAARVDTLEDGQIEFERELKRQQAADRLAVKMAKLAQPIAQSQTALTPAVTTVSTTLQSSDAVSAATLKHFKVLHGIAGEFTTAQARDALPLSAKGVGNVLQSAVAHKILDKKGRGIYKSNGTHPDSIQVK